MAYAGTSLRYGHEAVIVFFALSGFFIHLRAAQRMSANKPASLNTADFARRRIHRLLVPYLFALGLTLLCDLTGRALLPELYEAKTGDSLLDINFARKDFSWAAVGPACVVLPGSLGKDFGSNGPLWSLAFEVVYYALYPLWLRARRISSWFAYALIPAGCASAMFLPGTPWITSVAINYPIWLAGAGLAEWTTRRRSAPRFGPAVVMGLIGIAIPLTVFKTSVMQILFPILLATSIVWLFTKLPSTWTVHWWHHVWEFLGIRGYTIYICHFPVLVVLSAAAIHFDGKRPLSGWFAVIGALVTLGICCLAFEVCERHFLHARIGASDGGRGAPH
jgi:peptidoglycan/LPS O-acetylase OafA/YrhL